MPSVGQDGGRETREARAAERRRIEADRQRRGRNVWWRRGYRVVRRETGGLAARLMLPPAVRALAASWRVEFEGRELFEAAARTGFLAALWHGRMLPLLPLHRGRGFGVLVSPSRDGALVEAALRRFGYRVIRGSSNRYGARALREMRDVARDGGCVVITPDGPRGPRHSMNVGLAWLARETGLGVLTVGVACDRAWRMKSWDRFVVPKPRARIAVRYGELLAVEPGAGEAELEAATRAIRDRLFECETDACRRLDVPPDW